MHGIADVTFDFIEKLSEVTPDGMGYVKTYSGASEAMESAIKFSRQYHKQSGSPGKYKFLSRYQSYHGATMGAMSASGTGMRKTPFEPQLPGFLKLWPPTYFQERLPEVILPAASGVSNEGGSSPLLVLVSAVSWPWVPAWGSLEPSRRGGENAQKREKTGEKWARYSLRSVKEGS